MTAFRAPQQWGYLPYPFLTGNGWDVARLDPLMQGRLGNRPGHVRLPPGFITVRDAGNPVLPRRTCPRQGLSQTRFDLHMQD